MKTENEKPLGEIARIAFEMTPHTPLDEPWANVATAVIAEHERRKEQADPNAECKAAFAEGKVIQYFSKSGHDWLDCDPCPPSWLPYYEYRVKPDPVPYASKSSGQIVDLVESILKILKSQQP